MIVNMKEKVELMKTACATPDEALLETWEKEFRAKALGMLFLHCCAFFYLLSLSPLQSSLLF